MNIHVFLLCYNEEPLLPHAVAHYRKYMPSCRITICDNYSTDSSVQLALRLGCDVVYFDSGNVMHEFPMLHIRNNVWKDDTSGWIVMADMDEFVCVTEQELVDEMNSGTTILKIKGADMIGESMSTDLKDINLQEIQKCMRNDNESKNLVFLRDSIVDMNYGWGCHTCQPVGTIRYSDKVYLNKHMSYLGLPFITDKMIKRYDRNALMRSGGLNIHYMNDVSEIETRYNNYLKDAISVEYFQNSGLPTNIS